MKYIRDILNRKEKKEFDKFKEEHRKCALEHKDDCLGNFEGYTILIIPTEVGDIIKLKCTYCGEERDITDVDCW